MCITRITGELDFKTLDAERIGKIKRVMEAKKKELQTELKSLNAELHRLNATTVSVPLRQVK
jgi:ABC-type phosphate transport system auxiliary subunit